MESDPQYPLRTYCAKRLKKRLVQPRLPGSELHGSLRDCYKIKLRQQGYRLVYSVDDGQWLCWFWPWTNARTWLPTNLRLNACCHAVKVERFNWNLTPIIYRHCERSAAIQPCASSTMDRHAALAMTNRRLILPCVEKLESDADLCPAIYVATNSKTRRPSKSLVSGLVCR